MNRAREFVAMRLRALAGIVGLDDDIDCQRRAMGEERLGLPGVMQVR